MMEKLEQFQRDEILDLTAKLNPENEILWIEMQRKAHPKTYFSVIGNYWYEFLTQDTFARIMYDRDHLVIPKV